MKKILVIRFSSIGDIVLTSPVVRCLQKQTGAEIHFITKKSFAGIVANNPYISKVYSFEDSVHEVGEQLKAEQYDFVVDLHHNVRSLQVKRLLKVPYAAFPKLNIEKWLLVNLKINRLPAIHIVDRYFQTVKKLGVKNDGAGLDYFIPEADHIAVETLPATHRTGYIALVTGAKFATKQMPVSKMVEIIHKLNRPVVLLGGKEDTETGEAVAAGCGALVYNACGKYNLSQSASLLKQADFVITHDTGLMHIAAALKKKIYSVWGNTVPAFGMTPYLPGEGSKIIEVKNLACRPCSKIGHSRCPKGHFRCMTEINPDSFTS